MGLSNQLSYVARQYGWELSFDGEYYQGVSQRCDWPLPVDERQVLAVRLGSKPHMLVPPSQCTTFSINILRKEGEKAFSRQVAVVDPELANDCQDEVLYAALLHLTLLPPTTRWSLAVPSKYATAVNGNHLALLREPRQRWHPPQYRVGGEFYRFPHPLPVVPDENALETIILAQRLPEHRFID